MSSDVRDTWRLHLIATGLALTLTTTIGSLVEAQTVSELEARVERLQIQRDAARQVHDSAEAANRSRLVAQTMTVGTLTLVATEPDLALVFAGVPAAWTTLQTRLGSDTMLLRDMPLQFSSSPVWSRKEDPGPLLVRIIRSVGGHVPSPEFDDELASYTLSFTWGSGLISNPGLAASPTAEQSSAVLLEAVRNGITESMPGEVRSWAGPMEWEGKARGTVSAYRDVLTGTDRLGRLCLQGDLARCRAGLGLSQAATFLEWYDDEDLLRIASRYRPGYWDSPAQTETRERCQGDRVVDACKELLLARFGSSAVVPPFGIVARNLMLATAMEMGGDGAVGRTIEARGSLEQRLVTIAQQPIDSITARWRASVLETAGHSVDLSLASGAFAFIWACAFGVLALRNASWR